MAYIPFEDLEGIIKTIKEVELEMQQHIGIEVDIVGATMKTLAFEKED